MRGKQRFFTGAAAAAALILVLGAVLPLRAQVPAAFVDIGYGARPMGMGGAFTALSDDAHAIFWNPAGLAGLGRSELTLMHTKQLGLIPYTMLAYAGRLGTWGAGLGVLSSGNDVLRETTILFSFARTARLPFLGMTAIGVNLRYRTASFGNNAEGGENRSRGSASGFALELGALWEIGGNTRLGLFLRDLVNDMRYDNTARKVSYSEKVPATWAIGLSRKMGEVLILSADWEPPLQDERPGRIRFGGELAPIHLIRLRAGIWQNLAAEVNRNYALGIGLNYRRGSVLLLFDFAYLINDLANTPRISLSLCH